MGNTHQEEKKKYEKCWDTDSYRIHSPGENSLKAFKEIVKPFEFSSIVDCGSGTARASLVLAKEDYGITMLDITNQSMDDEVRDSVSDMVNLNFFEVNLWNPRDMDSHFCEYDYAYCCDVMEHIPTEYVMATLQNIMNTCKTGAFFYVCLVPDGFGQIIGSPLHLTVKPFLWWRDKLAELGKVVDARDLISNGMYYVEKEVN